MDKKKNLGLPQKKRYSKDLTKEILPNGKHVIRLSNFNVNKVTPWLREHYNPTISETGIKAVKQENRPENRPFKGIFNKELPLTPYNYPCSKFTVWKAFGYRKDMLGHKKYHWIEKTLPTGHAFIPDLDVTLKITHHQIF